MAHADAHDSEGHDDAHDDHHEAPPPAEPETPMWLTLLGAALFVSAGLFFVLMTGEVAPGEGAGASAKPDSAGTAAAAPEAAQPRLRPAGNVPLRPLNLPQMRPQAPAGGHLALI
jgi:hypothetical protein